MLKHNLRVGSRNFRHRATASMAAVRIAPFILIAVCCGCSAQDDHSTDRSSTPVEYAKLAGLKATPNRQLRDELARIVEEGGTPELLAEELPPEGRNAAAGLADLFPPEKVAEILARSTKLMPIGPFEFSPIELECAVRFRKKYNRQRMGARAALGRPECNLGIDHESGFLADLEQVDVVWICARLEAFAAAEALSKDKPGKLDKAVDSFSYVMRLAACLADEKRVACRMEAALLRGEAFGLLRVIVDDPQTDRGQLDKLCGIVETQLKSWPNDAGAWIGDRALGMHAYEMVRDGKILALLTAEEIKEFQREETLDTLPELARKTVDKDEIFYLNSMRNIIAACNRPYHERHDLFEQIEKELQAKLAAAEFPIVAGRMLLVDIEKGHAVQARDRAECEAWALALAQASGRRPPLYTTNPLTGKPYRVLAQDGLITIWNVGNGQDNERPIVVKDMMKDEG